MTWGIQHVGIDPEEYDDTELGANVREALSAGSVVCGPWLNIRIGTFATDQCERHAQDAATLQAAMAACPHCGDA